jgi:hypothetical protein
MDVQDGNGNEINVSDVSSVNDVLEVEATANSADLITPV